jgi:hypothetical protein
MGYLINAVKGSYGLLNYGAHKSVLHVDEQNDRNGKHTILLLVSLWGGL